MNNVKELVTVKIDEITPYWRNPRNIEKAVEAVKKSIQEYGYNNPIVVDINKVIICGHTRYRALKELGYEEINVIITDLEEDKAKQFRIVDNKTNELAKWDNELLMFELREIQDLENMKNFFSDKEFKNMNISFEDMENELIENESENENNNIIDNDYTENNVNNEDKKIDKKLEKVKDYEENKFEKRSIENENDYIEIVCPYCEKDYTLSKRELLQSNSIPK